MAGLDWRCDMDNFAVVDASSTHGSPCSVMDERQLSMKSKVHGMA